MLEASSLPDSEFGRAMSAISPSLRIFSEGVAFFPILPRPACGGARLLTCEPLSTIDCQAWFVAVLWSLSGLAAWGGSMGVDPPAGQHCSVMSIAAAAAAARATGWIDILHVLALLLVLRYRKGFGRVGPDGKAKAKWLPCNANSMCRQMQNEFDIILHLINYDH